MNHAGARQQEGRQGCNLSSPSPQTSETTGPWDTGTPHREIKLPISYSRVRIFRVKLNLNWY